MSKHKIEPRQASEQNHDRDKLLLRPGELIVIQQDKDGGLHLISAQEVDFSARGQVFVGIESMLPNSAEIDD